MIVLPAVDILQGEVVQLKGGRPEEKLWAGQDPVAVARRWIDEGAERLHLVDLTAAIHGQRDAKIKDVLSAVDVPVHVGGGIREGADAAMLIEAGAERVVVGTAAWTKPGFLKELTAALPGRVLVALETRQGRVAVEGWKTTLPLQLDGALEAMEGSGAWGVLHTCVDVEGTLGGLNRAELEQVVRRSGLPVIASGGVATVDDVAAARDAGAWGVVVGSSLYLGSLTIAQARAAAQ